MCHYYGNALSILNGFSGGLDVRSNIIQPQHLQAIRMLPSFRILVEKMTEEGRPAHARHLLLNDAILVEDVRKTLASRDTTIIRLLRAMNLLTSSSLEPVDKISLYMATFEGGLGESEYVARMLDSIKRMTPEELASFIVSITESVEKGTPEMDLNGWTDEESEFLGEMNKIRTQVAALVEQSLETGKPVRSSYAIHSKGVRTTVIAQRVQLSYEKSTLTEQDKAFTALVDRLSQGLVGYFSLENPKEIFLNEVWLYDSTLPYRNVFTPRPRAAIELALSAPYKYLSCDCCEAVEGLSSTHPATAILYQMYLETGSLINIFDLWSAFFEMVGGGDEQKIDERDALVLFYRALADLKQMGMVKQSKKKADHLAKVTWKDL